MKTPPGLPADPGGRRLLPQHRSDASPWVREYDLSRRWQQNGILPVTRIHARPEPFGPLRVRTGVVHAEGSASVGGCPYVFGQGTLSAMSDEACVDEQGGKGMRPCVFCNHPVVIDSLDEWDCPVCGDAGEGQAAMAGRDS